MARKKIVFVIVEGPSDETALGLLLNQYYAPLPVYVQIMRRDITTEQSATPANILSRVAGEIQKYAKDNHLQMIHFQEMIHLADMDGYRESWDYIKKDLHSLERHTNFGLCLVPEREENP